MKQERITEIAERNVSTLSSVNKEAIVEMCENAITEALMEASKISSNPFVIKSVCVYCNGTKKINIRNHHKMPCVCTRE